jgi:hypothetical protein
MVSQLIQLVSAKDTTSAASAISTICDHSESKPRCNVCSARTNAALVASGRSSCATWGQLNSVQLNSVPHYVWVTNVQAVLQGVLCSHCSHCSRLTIFNSTKMYQVIQHLGRVGQVGPSRAASSRFNLHIGAFIGLQGWVEHIVKVIQA